MAKQKVSEYLSTLDGHEIYTHADLAKDFTEQTGEEAFWQPIKATVMRRRVEARGLGGYLDGDEDCIDGVGIAEALAYKYAEFRPTTTGRGSRFRECQRAIKQAGH